MNDNLNISGLRVGAANSSRSERGSFASDTYERPESGAYEYKPRQRKGTSERLAERGSEPEAVVDPETEYLRRKAFHKFMFYLFILSMALTVAYQGYYYMTKPAKLAAPPREMGPQKVVPLWLK